MQLLMNKVLFDERDHALLKMIDDALDRKVSRKSFKHLLNPFLNPHGIKEMAASQGFRIAYAMINLLHSLEIGKADDRLNALHTLRDEVMNITHSALRRNTARVLLQIIKELVRQQGNQKRQLELAHDFRMAVSGKPRLIRRELAKYHLLEMPEEWNQIAFDDHVHDANTKGRKTPTHLIMDAWIKGIRRLTVNYYNYVPAEAAAELLKAGEIMGIAIRIGVSVGAHFRGRDVRFIWVPRGFCDANDFLSFLSDGPVKDFMDEGKRISEYYKSLVIQKLEEFNRTQRTALNEEFGIRLEPLEAEDFLSFVAGGQASKLHLSEFIHGRLLPLLMARVEEMRENYPQANPEERQGMVALTAKMNELDSEAILTRYLAAVPGTSLSGPLPSPTHPEIRALLMRTPRELAEKLDRLHSGYRICLNLSDLTVEDVLEMLYDCRGMITHLEIFNLKDHVDGKTSHYQGISQLQKALNEGNVITLKRMILDIRQEIEKSGRPDSGDRCAKLTEILRNIPALQAHYRAVPLGAYIGSDSTGRSPHRYGMGLVLPETLTRRAQKAIPHTLGPKVFVLPVRMTVYLRKTYIPRAVSGVMKKLGKYFGPLLPIISRWGRTRQRDWEIKDNATHMDDPGNVVPLGGLHEEGGNELFLFDRRSRAASRFAWKYLNSHIKNLVKVVVGFIPAFLTFALTKDWWLLAYGGAFIWFGITGLRNILQSVLGGGGFRRSPLLRWNDYVSWNRLTDSLLYTGFSVPLLDYIVKTVILDRSFGVTTATHPFLLYTVMALANGLYLSSHNAFRGLPRGAIVGNFFRSVLSIPLAIIFNDVAGQILKGFHVTMVDDVLQKWAAVISKAASDCVAGVIEGLADRYENMDMRMIDYRTKLTQLFDIYAKLELLFPEANVLEMLESPKEFIKTISSEASDLEKIIIINALDLLYFWMYQPRARSVLRVCIRSMSSEERQCFIRSQSVLRREKEISQLFLDGIIGSNFSRGLSFYLDRYREYIDILVELARDSGIQGSKALANHAMTEESA